MATDLEIVKANTDILKIVHKRELSAAELERVLSSIENAAPKQIQSFEDYFEARTRIGVFSDCHIGAREFDEPLFRHMIKTFNKRKVSRIYQAGDILEGMSGREGQIYDLSEIGYQKQMEKAIRLFRSLPVDTYGIDGNHDEWFQKKNNAGVIVGAELDNAVPRYHNLGQDEANVRLRPNVTMKLIHPGDGALAYALSYKPQRRIEAFSGGEKPEIMLEGNYHKALYMFYRNIHSIDCATLCGQTRWMRGKNIAAMKGFWIIDMEFGRGGIGMFAPQFYPGYK